MTEQLRSLALWLCLVFFASPVFAQPAHSGLPFAVSADLLPTRQMVIGYDLTQSGVIDYWTSHALIEFLPGPASCRDHDAQYLLIATEGFYRVRATPDLQRAKRGDWQGFNPAAEQPEK